MQDAGCPNTTPFRPVLLAALVLLALVALACDVGRAPGVLDAQEDGDVPLEVEVLDLAEVEIGVEVVSNGYIPGSDVLIGLHGNEVDPELYLLSPEGEVLVGWRILDRTGATLLDRRVLPNGNVMFVLRGDGAFEMTPDGEIAWFYEADDITHHAQVLPNGNVLVAGALCDCVREIDYDTGEVAWEWYARDSFPDYDTEETFRGSEGRDMTNLYASTYSDEREWPNTWAHVNYAQVLPSGNVIASLRNFDLVVEVSREGDIVWSWGPGIIKHQHTPVDLEDGTMLVFDNGNHRAMRFSRTTGEIEWVYDDLDSGIMGEVNLLADGNYKVVDSLRNTVLVVSPSGELLWSLGVEPPEEISGIYRAHFPDLEN